jgi:hypothetical protein
VKKSRRAAAASQNHGAGAAAGGLAGIKTNFLLFFGLFLKFLKIQIIVSR